MIDMRAETERRVNWLPPVAQVAGFAIVGAMRTVTGYAAYVALLLVAPYWVAFSISYAAVLVGSFVANGKYVFKSDVTLLRGVRYALAYCGNYLVSLGILTLAIRELDFAPALAPAVVIPLMFPINFITERYALIR